MTRQSSERTSTDLFRGHLSSGSVFAESSRLAALESRYTVDAISDMATAKIAVAMSEIASTVYRDSSAASLELSAKTLPEDKCPRNRSVLVLSELWRVMQDSLQERAVYFDAP